jgi:cell division protein FtsL
VHKEPGNTAVAYQIPESTPKTHTQQRKKKIFKGLPAGEKMLYLASVVVCFVFAVFIMTRYAHLTQLDVSIQQTEKQINRAKEVNLQLESEKMKLSSLEQIRQFAEQNDLQFIPTIQP